MHGKVVKIGIDLMIGCPNELGSVEIVGNTLSSVGSQSNCLESMHWYGTGACPSNVLD